MGQYLPNLLKIWYKSRSPWNAVAVLKWIPETQRHRRTNLWRHVVEFKGSNQETSHTDYFYKWNLLSKHKWHWKRMTIYGNTLKSDQRLKRRKGILILHTIAKAVMKYYTPIRRLSNNEFHIFSSRISNIRRQSLQKRVHIMENVILLIAIKKAITI